LKKVAEQAENHNKDKKNNEDKKQNESGLKFFVEQQST
jgi:hypothetical protein